MFHVLQLARSSEGASSDAMCEQGIETGRRAHQRKCELCGFCQLREEGVG